MTRLPILGRPVVNAAACSARVLLPRPAIRGHEGKPYHAPGACRTGCTFHSAAGCELTFAARPEQCRVLPPDPEPDVDRKVCSGPEWSSDKSMALRWRSRTAELEAMLERISRARAA